MTSATPVRSNCLRPEPRPTHRGIAVKTGVRAGAPRQYLVIKLDEVLISSV